MSQLWHHSIKGVIITDRIGEQCYCRIITFKLISISTILLSHGGGSIEVCTTGPALPYEVWDVKFEVGWKVAMGGFFSNPRFNFSKLLWLAVNRFRVAHTKLPFDYISIVTLSFTFPCESSCAVALSCQVGDSLSCTQAHHLLISPERKKCNEIINVPELIMNMYSKFEISGVRISFPRQF